jgi:hypothetical protein
MSKTIVVAGYGPGISDAVARRALVKEESTADFFERLGDETDKPK